ncbi:MAG: hypothetical protein GY696_30995 [Gammaproteobacteria bacterium]|nr:hypothetical protein [Gammaproteobacteria bacterium]
MFFFYNLGEQYYNPCWAGCTTENRTTGRYINCSCAFSRPTPMQISAPLLNLNTATASGGGNDDDLEYGGGESGYAAVTSDNDGPTSAQPPPPLAAATGSDIGGGGEEIGPVGEPGLCKEWNNKMIN